MFAFRPCELSFLPPPLRALSKLGNGDDDDDTLAIRYVVYLRDRTFILLLNDVIHTTLGHHR